jgi:hypothetical protein
MMRRETKRPTLTVRVSYEADRLSGQHLADAFERLVATIVRRSASVPDPDLDRAAPGAPAADIAVRRGRP